MITEDPFKKQVSYTAGFFMLIAFGVAGLMFSGLLGGLVWNLMTGQPIEEMQKNIGNTAYLAEFQVFQSLRMFMGMLVPTIVTATFLSHNPGKLVGFKSNIKSWQVFFTIAIILCGLAISSGLGYLSYQLPLGKTVKEFFDQIEGNYAEQAMGLIDLKTVQSLVISIIVMALVPAVCEEAFFRGGLQNFLYRSNKNPWISVVVVSLIFSAIHISGYGFLSRFALGIILGLIYHYSGNIWLSILAHFINNTIAVLMMYGQVQSGKSAVEVMNDKTGSYWGLLALPVVVLLFVMMNKRARQTELADGV